MQEVLELARSGEAQARLVRCKAGQWRVSHGPHERLPALRTPDWTVLVNGVDRHLEAVHALLQSFRFIPDARIDDLMISVAGDGGGVGPHLDSYDVFLLQAHGKRRWRIAPPGNWQAVADAPLKLIANFRPTQEWILEPGDMLYLPPGWAHEGTAVGACMTFSIGARAPSRHEFLAALLADLADTPGGVNPRFRDARRKISSATKLPNAKLPDDLIGQLQQWAESWRPSRSATREFIGRWLTEPAADAWFEGPMKALTPLEFERKARAQGIRLDRATRMAWHARQLFMNGELVNGKALGLPALRLLADKRELGVADLSGTRLSPETWHLLGQWHQQGWLHLAD